MGVLFCCFALHILVCTKVLEVGGGPDVKPPSDIEAARLIPAWIPTLCGVETS